ncbi:hypothetical protein FA95DRAFT_1553089 [Auriscalpium vulgare]|uniref:Uncharacterized protein n=1 Tax=Auriscalpium vulgare TaxID=40419 RepID=A0ACB8SA72_9AGAM|nr:hypothetical protein FA95DRAFT_1553089 [Auriscalpium vulgare]
MAKQETSRTRAAWDSKRHRGSLTWRAWLPTSVDGMVYQYMCLTTRTNSAVRYPNRRTLSKHPRRTLANAAPFCAIDLIAVLWGAFRILQRCARWTPILWPSLRHIVAFTTQADSDRDEWGPLCSQNSHIRCVHANYDY